MTQADWEYEKPVTSNEVMDNLYSLMDILPPHLQESLTQSGGLENLLEVVLDLGRPPEARFSHGDFQLDFREVTQDVSSHLEWAKQMRETKSSRNNFSHGFKPFCNIPDSVSLELMSKYGINIHSNQKDRDALKRVKSIIKRDYPHLMYH